MVRSVDRADDMLIVKHTFLELECTTTEAKNRRRTEPAMNSVLDALDESDTENTVAEDTTEAKALPGDDNIISQSVIATPEASPLLYPLDNSSMVPWTEPPSWHYGWNYGNTPLMMDCFELPPAYAGDWYAPYENVAWTLDMQSPCMDLAMLNLHDGLMSDVNNHIEVTQWQTSVDPSWTSQNNKGKKLVANKADTTTHKAHARPADNETDEETRTSVLLRDVPESYTRDMLVRLLEAEGFLGLFDFVYLPVDFKNRVNLSYAFVNMVSPAHALKLCEHFEGFSHWRVPSERVCTVGWCSPQQGLEAHIERYRNSPVMHESVPEEWRPMLFSQGQVVPFPPPTTHVKAPKLRKLHTS